MRNFAQAGALLALLASSPLYALDCGAATPDPSRIAVAGGSVTEILYALGEEERIVAVDTTSTYPPQASSHPRLGYVRNLSTEGLLSMDPTLILGEHDMGPASVVSQLERMGIAVLQIPEGFDAAGILDKVRCVAGAIGARDKSAALIEELEAQAADLASNIPGADRPPRGVVLLALQEGAPLAAGRNTAGHGLLQMAGAVNVMAEIEGWNPVSSEAMVRARPDFIVIPERGLRAAGGTDRLLDHPALRLTPAAADRRVIAMDGMALLGFGPRTLGAAQRLQTALHPGGDRP